MRINHGLRTLGSLHHYGFAMPGAAAAHTAPDAAGAESLTRAAPALGGAVAAGLCAGCGLCCNGVLFDQVQLQKGENAKALRAQGLKLKKGTCFKQPCIALCGTRCLIYQHRPLRCRQFECRLLAGFTDGRISGQEAIRLVEKVQEQVRWIDELLLGTGASNLRKPLLQRCATALEKRPEATENVPLREAMKVLGEMLDTHFRT